MFTGMHLVVTLAAYHHEVLFDVWAVVLVVFDVMKFKNPWVVGGPSIEIPPAYAARVVVSFVHVLLNGFGDAPVMRFGNALFGLQDVARS